MGRRATSTAYFLNRALGCLALVGRNVRLPEVRGRWIEVADAICAPWEVADILAGKYAGFDTRKLPFVALLADDDVDEFEREMAQTSESAPAEDPVVQSA
jgi:hypothetical protein